MSGQITVAGGFYRESCRLPPSDEFWGSGGRAAAAIAELGVDTNFLTAVDHESESMLASIAQTFGFKYTVSQTPKAISFRYTHGLATPMIWPPIHTIERVKMEASGECVLQFGMLEADVRVDAGVVIYDPQEPESPRHFQPVRKPSRLAYVLNRGEARKLGQSEDLERAARTIAKESGANVVVIKCGASGSLVLENGEIESVPVFETSSVWPIGSGDVFASVFAVEWGVRCGTARRAATSASQGTAEYVENRVLPIPREVVETASPRTALTLRRPSGSANDYDVYLAGPFFNMAQLWLVEEARLALQGMGLRVFSPYHDVGIGKGIDVAPKDIAALEKSRAVLALIDGEDTGTVFEAGYARAHTKPVVAFAQSTAPEALKMISGTGCEVVNDFVSAIYRVSWAACR